MNSLIDRGIPLSFISDFAYGQIEFHGKDHSDCSGFATTGFRDTVKPCGCYCHKKRKRS